MKYTRGSIGRVLVAKIEHGDDLLLELNNLAEKEEIKSALMIMLGAMKKASLVVGPKECTVPPEPVWRGFTDGREVLGIGTVFCDGSQPVLHLHSVFGRGDDVLAGCVREGAEAYLVAEVVVLELLGLSASRGIDPTTGMKMLSIP